MDDKASLLFLMLYLITQLSIHDRNDLILVSLKELFTWDYEFDKLNVVQVTLTLKNLEGLSNISYILKFPSILIHLIRKGMSIIWQSKENISMKLKLCKNEYGGALPECTR